MELLFESALEAIIFRHSTTFSGYIWTFLAFFAAALSLWRFHFLGSASECVSKPPETTSPVPAAVVASTPPIVPSAILTLDCSDRMECESTTKGKFTMYFLAEAEADGDDVGGEWVSDIFSSNTDCLDSWNWGWRGDLGWYTYQDRSAINGSVVKLWNIGRRGLAVVPAIRQRWI